MFIGTIISFAIVAFAVVFLTTLYWVATTLNTSRQHYQDYQKLKSLVVVDLNRLISDYLLTGEATLLTESSLLFTRVCLLLVQLLD